MKNMEFVGNTHRAPPHHPSFDRIPHITMTGEGKQSAEQNRIEQNRTEQRPRRTNRRGGGGTIRYFGLRIIIQNDIIQLNIIKICDMIVYSLQFADHFLAFFIIFFF